MSTAPPMAKLPPALGWYLVAVQFVFALGWVVYAAYLPQLLARLGPDLPVARIVPWILALDQLIFVITDLVVGIWSDKAALTVGRLSRLMVVATVASCLAFAALPWIAQPGDIALFMAVTAVWAVTSSALRAPPLTLLSRYVPKSRLPVMAALMALGLGLCNAVAPFIGLLLKGVEPHIPFLLSALALTAVTLGMGWAERSLRRHDSEEPVPASSASPPAGLGAEPMKRASLAFVMACLLMAAAFQLHVFLMSPALYARHVPAALVPHWMPWYWVGFNLSLWPACRLAKRMGALPAMAWGAGASVLALVAVHLAPGLHSLATAQALAGAAWALVLCAAFCTPAQLGKPGREGFYNGALQSILASGALLRLLVVAMWAPAAGTLLQWKPAVWTAFGLAAALLVWGAWPRQAAARSA